MNTVVLGIGNTLLSDEGVGVHSIYYLKKQFLDSPPPFPDVSLIDGGTLSFTLAAEIEKANNLIVIDAAELHDKPGAVKTFINQEMDEFLGIGNKRSVHEVSLLDLLSISRLSGHCPEQRALVGVQPKVIDWGEYPSRAVADAIPQACQQVLHQIRRWYS